MLHDVEMDRPNVLSGFHDEQMSAVVASIAAVDVTDRRQAVNHFGHHLELSHAHSEIDDGFCGQARYGGVPTCWMSMARCPQAILARSHACAAS